MCPNPLTRPLRKTEKEKTAGSEPLRDKVSLNRRALLVS